MHGFLLIHKTYHCHAERMVMNTQHIIAKRIGLSCMGQLVIIFRYIYLLFRFHPGLPPFHTNS